MRLLEGARDPGRADSLHRQVEVVSEELRKRVADAKLPEAVLDVATREIDRLERMTPASPEYQMIRTYLDWLTSLPWSTTTQTS